MSSKEDVSEKAENDEGIGNSADDTGADTSETRFAVNDVIDSFIHRVLDIEDCASAYISAAAEKYNENADRLRGEITGCQTVLDAEEDRNRRLLAVRQLRKIMREIDRHNSSLPVDTLEKSLFINLFAAFDKYIGDIVAVLYHRNSGLYKNINREVALSEALKYETMDELRQAMLDKEIEALRRKSYIEQFKELENKFSIKLTKFDDWALFVERSQRRNLFTHCDGVVSKQYLEVCALAGYKFDGDIKIGDQLKIGSKYLFDSCMLIAQVAVMLGQTLWRKVNPDELEQADRHLTSLIFDYLHAEHWSNAISLSKFAQALPKISTDEMQRIFAVNYAIALKEIGKGGAAKNILDRKDWTASIYDFRLAYAVLTDNFEEAKELMKKIGKQGGLINELSYHDWPLFREFRESDEFFCGYEEVYGYKYSTKLSEIAKEKKGDVAD